MLSVSDLRVSYGGIEAVKSATFEVQRAEIVTIIGANGAGKSSILRAIMGLAAKRGLVALDQTDISRWPTERVVAAGVSFVGDGRQLFHGMSCRDNLRAALFAQRAEHEFAARASVVFDLFPKLRDRLAQRAGTLSGGEQQMLAIGRALMQKPALLLLDEPSQGLSPALTDEVFAAIRRIRDMGRAVLLVEQRAERALDVADRAYVLVIGRITIQGSGRQLLQDLSVQKEYFGL